VKRILLTGASSGIGLAIAQSLVGQGYEVWGTSRNVARLPQVNNFHPVELDLRDPNGVDGAFARASRESGGLDVVINNAGSGHFGATEFLTMSEIADQFQIIFFSHARLMQLALADMRSRKSGLIINITSLAARLPVPDMAAYNAAKAAMSAFTMSVQLELPKSGVALVDLQPGDIKTNFNDVVNKNSSGGPLVAKVWEAVDRNMKQAPGPELVAAQVLKLIANSNPPPRITVGDFFPTVVAPLIFRFLPQRVRLWGLKNYYGI
jgi:uncharacterized protein